MTEEEQEKSKIDVIKQYSFYKELNSIKHLGGDHYKYLSGDCVIMKKQQMDILLMMSLLQNREEAME